MATPISTTARSSKRQAAKTVTKSAPTPIRTSDVVAPMIDPEHRRALIAEAAYFIAERRNFAPGNEAEDWLNAESAVDTALTLGVTPTNN
jgi:hypothetical protein